MIYTGKRLAVTLLAFVLCFASLLKKFIPVLQYSDEFIACFSVVFVLVYMFLNKMPFELYETVLLSIMAIAIGALSSFLAKNQDNLIAVGTDALTMFKFVPIFWFGYILAYDMNNRERVWKLLSFLIRIFVLVGAVCAVLNFITDINMYTDIRYGLRAFQFVYSRVGGLYNACSIFLGIQTMDIYYNGERPWKDLFIFITIFIMLCTLRARAFAYAAFFIYGYYIIVKGRRIRFSWWQVLFGGALLIAVSFNQIVLYFGSMRQPRSILLHYGIETVKKYFPFGAGFASFATNPAKVYGSKLHVEYGFNNIWGLGRGKSTYLTDTYWPAIFGELGLFGGLIVAAVILILFIFAIKRLKGASVPLFAAAFLFGTVLIASAATQSFMTGSTQMFLTGVIVSQVLSEKKKEVLLHEG